MPAALRTSASCWRAFRREGRSRCTRRCGTRHGSPACVALSTYLVDPAALAAEASPANRDLPIFMAHGTFDPVVRHAWAEASRDALVRGGWNVEWHSYPMEHSAVLEEIVAAGNFLRRVLGGPAT